MEGLQEQFIDESVRKRTSAFISRILRISEAPKLRELVEDTIYTDRRLPEQLVIPPLADPNRAESVLH